jgi:glycosyltransferase involved in cell wall biosynthesis
LPPTLPDGRPWPRITIVTPSYNAAPFIEETIRSVLLQGYPNLEYIIIDGGSRDGTVDVIEKYAKFLAYWRSEPDRGQTHAINEGLKRATGDIWSFINADDWLAPGALSYVGQRARLGITFATSVRIREGDRSWVWPNRGISYGNVLLPDRAEARTTSLHALGHWMPREKIQALGGYNERYQYFADLEILLRYLAAGGEVDHDEFVTVNFRQHDAGKTSSAWHQFEREHLEILRDNLAIVGDAKLRAELRRFVRSKELTYRHHRHMESVTSMARQITAESNSRLARTTNLLALMARQLTHPPAARFVAGQIRRALLGG